MKRKVSELSSRERIQTLDALYTAASSLKGRETMKSFLRDLLTPSERIMLGRRILIARMLIEGRSSREIVADLRIGLDTVGRVQRWLTDQFPGYEKAVKGIKKEHAQRKRRVEKRALFATLKRKYPLHFLLFPWPKGYGPGDRLSNKKEKS